MAFLEWRKFNFFDLKKNVDDGRLIELFKESEISVTTSGNNNLIIGDTLGQIYIILRTWTITAFRAYEVSVLLMQQLQNSSFLITIGEDEHDTFSLIKVWDTSRIDRNNQPHCTRISRCNANPSVLCVHESMALMAIGFKDGTLMLYRGDVTRERTSRMKMLRETSSEVTGLALKSSANTILLYVATQNSIYIYNVTHKDKEAMSLLCNKGCAKNCSVLAESLQESHFMVARKDAIYCYTNDGKGPCYAVDGEKVMLQWFRSYLIIVSKSSRVTPTQEAATTNQSQNTHLITVLDIQNKFIVFQTLVDEIRAILNEWGGFYIIDVHNQIFHLNEKDVQSKLSKLFKKNLYDIAIRIAKSQQYDTDGLIDIFRQYGDHLYSKSDHAGAIDQYVKTIGKLEPSYVIRKFMDSKHIDKLTSYLEALHKQGHATEDHTTLLLNCLTKLNKTDHLKEFILQKDRELDFDVDIAIKVCRQSSPEEALMLAKRHRKHDWYIKLQLEDHQRYTEVVDYINDLNFVFAQLYMKKYGGILLLNAGNAATQLLKKLCTNFKDSKFPEQRANAEDYIHLFLNDSTRLVEFLDCLIQEGCTLSSCVYDTLLEHCLHVWQAATGPEEGRLTQKILKLLQTPSIQYDKHQALVVCHMHGFSEGILHLYEEQKLYQQILRHHISTKNATAVLGCCKRFGHQEPTLWVQALWSCVRDPGNWSDGLLPDVLDVIAKERLLSPQIVMEAVGTGKADITLSQIKTYARQELRKEYDVLAVDKELTLKYRKDTDDLKLKLANLKSSPILIQGSRCAACHYTLELPSLHFLCQHSYHQHCFQSYSENENECLACQPENKKLLELLKAREFNKDLHETFHSQLDKANDAFSLAAEYFGRSVFNTVKVITEKPKIQPIQSPHANAARKKEDSLVNADTTSEISAEVIASRSRSQENNKHVTPVVTITEGRAIRVSTQENRFSSSLEANISQHKHLLSSASNLASSVSSNASAQPSIASGNGNNPFDNPSVHVYDEAKNPFGDGNEDLDGGANPFKDASDEDDYDKNLNPFA